MPSIATGAWPRPWAPDRAPIEFHVPIPFLARQWAEEQLSGWPRPWIMVGPGSRWQTKRWPTAHFAALASRTRKQFGGTIVLIGGGEEVPLAQQVETFLTNQDQRSQCLNLTGKTTLPQLSAVLSRADLMLANDTGPLHLAAALGRPVVAPYTCTSIHLTGPYRSGRALETTVWCQGSLRKRCSRLECMDELTPERLWPLVDEAMQTWQSNGGKVLGVSA